MMGENLNTTFVTDSGLIGDRVSALLDESTGKVASAKNPRKWGTLVESASGERGFVEHDWVGRDWFRPGS